MMHVCSTILKRLPPIGNQPEDETAKIFMIFRLPETPQRWYVTSGQSESNDYRFFGFVVRAESAWTDFWLSDMQRMTSAAGRSCESLMFSESQPLSAAHSLKF